MKKSTFFALASIFIVFFIVNTLGNKLSPYQKEIYFKTPEVAIDSFVEYINIYDEIDNNSRIRINNSTKEFKESISRRYRIKIESSNYNNLFNQMPVYVNYELEEISLEDNYILKNNYIDSLSGIPNYIKPKDVRAFYLKGEGIYGTFSRMDLKVNREKIIEKNDIIEENFFVIVVDEGEGYVVDYCMSNWEE